MFRYNKNESILIKSNIAYMGYWVADKKSQFIALFDDSEEAKHAILKLLNEGAEIYESDKDFYNTYSLSTLEDKTRTTNNLSKDDNSSVSKIVKVGHVAMDFLRVFAMLVLRLVAGVLYFIIRFGLPWLLIAAFIFILVLAVMGYRQLFKPF